MNYAAGVFSDQVGTSIKRNGFSWGRPVIFLLCLVPFITLSTDAIQDQLGANPIETLTRHTGTWALHMLLLTLAMTPMRMLTGNPAWIRWRRMLGLFTFFYASLHVAIYFLLDQGLAIAAILEDIGKRPYVTAGFLAFVLLLPLAATSNRYAIKRLGGRRWQRLHKMVYVVVAAVTLHLIWQVKSDYFEAVVYTTLFAVLMLFRVWRWTQSRLPVDPSARE